MQEPTKGADQKAQSHHGRKELSRQDLLSTAEHVFGLQGFHEDSLQAIAVRATFSTGALYRFFDHQEALFTGVLARRGDDLLQGLREPGSAGFC
jgi:AcrR family transcriptional regulator